ncbi:MAG TPA: hypothetical protein VLM40_18210, partial [Gemmata sp.]|nr:hypothetical protein [Gemmata sp.]
MTITITAQEQRAPGEPEAPKRTYTIVAGKPDPVANLLPVRLADFLRVSLVNDKIGSEPAGSWIGALL